MAIKSVRWQTVAPRNCAQSGSSQSYGEVLGRDREPPHRTAPAQRPSASAGGLRTDPSGPGRRDPRAGCSNPARLLSGPRLHFAGCADRRASRTGSRHGGSRRDAGLETSPSAWKSHPARAGARRRRRLAHHSCRLPARTGTQRALAAGAGPIYPGSRFRNWPHQPPACVFTRSARAFRVGS